MSKQTAAATRFRDHVRQARGQRKWSRNHLAKLLQDKGFEYIVASTVAKIEYGEREVRIDEANAIAELLDVSVDALLGRGIAPPTDRDQRHAGRVLLSAVHQASWQVETIEATLRDRLAELLAFQPGGWVGSLPADCATACDRLDDAANALRKALSPPGAEGFLRATRQMLAAELEEESDGTQA